MESPRQYVFRDRPDNYQNRYTDEELHELLDEMIELGGQWLLEVHFETWLRLHKRNRPPVLRLVKPKE